MPELTSSGGGLTCLNHRACPARPAAQAEDPRNTPGLEASVIRRAQRGNVAAFEQLVRQHDRAVLRLALHLTGSQEDAQDIYQEAFLRAYRNLGRFRFASSFYTWIYRIVTNLCLDHLRRKKSRPKDEIPSAPLPGREGDVGRRPADHRAEWSPERAVVRREVREGIDRALAVLSPQERLVFELKHYRDLNLKTVAAVLNASEGTVRNALFRATRKLRAELRVWRPGL